MSVKLRAIGYFKLTCNENHSLEEMERQFVNYCTLNMHQPTERFISNVKNGEKDNSLFQQMVDYIRTSSSEFLIVIPDATHIGKDLESVARSIVELDQIGCKVSCYNEEFPDPLQNAFQTLGIKGISRTRSQRIKESMRARALQGQALGKPLYGYQISPNGNLEIIPEESKVVELIFRLYISDGLGLRLIVQHLNDREIPTKRGGMWNIVSIRDILKNIAYTGTYTRLGVRRPKVHEPIISSETFRAAQDQTKSRRPIGRVVYSKPFLLSGMIFCNSCGNKMMGVTRRQSWKKKDGRRSKQIYRYYQCQSRNNRSVCNYHTWKESVLEGTVFAQLKILLESKNLQFSSSSNIENDSYKKSIALKKTAVQHAEKRFVQAMKRTANGNLSIKILSEYIKELDTAKHAMNGTAILDITETISNWDSLDIDTKKTFLSGHVSKISVGDTTVEVEI